MTGAGFVVRPDALDYLAGLTVDPARFPPEPAWHAVPVAARRLETVSGVRAVEPRPDGDARTFPTEPLLAGLAGARVPVVLQVTGRPDSVHFGLGTWADTAAELRRRHAVLTSLLDGAYPSVDRAAGPPEVPALPSAGVAVGVPAGVPQHGEAPWDRLSRALRGAEFAAVVLAEPVAAELLGRLRDTALEDLRTALAAQHARTDLPLTRRYGERIEALADSLDRAILTGGWRTAVYLLGDEGGYWRLAGAWRGAFADGDSPLAPLRVVTAAPATTLAARWALPDQAGPPGPRVWRHPFGNQTLLDTRQLAAYVHLPTVDTPGFAVRPAPAFAVSRQAPADESRAVRIGHVLVQQQRAGTTYRIDLDQFTRHTFVAGLTGSGKTNTLLHLLTEIGAAGVPFLVIEPAKTEYRDLLARPGFRGSLRVFTPGREQLAPLRLNPFEVPAGIEVATHLDLLKAVFMASFAMWVPLPQVLEQCLVQLYTERGWDFTTGRHSDGAADPPVPTLGELVAAVRRTVPTLGFKPESTQEITASLVTRLDALRRGSRGLMLDVTRSVPIGELLRAPTVIELDGLGDDADKAFVMGLLLIRLYEYRRAEHAAALAAAAARGEPAPPGGRLSHVVVIEEAHRLLANSTQAADSWHADPQGAFADTFSQMLSEVRAYGQGMIIADQVPVRLAPDVIKNTNLKIAHRLVAGDDRTAMGTAMSMDDEQSGVLPTLPRGRAAVFSEGDHTPVIVEVDPATGPPDAPAIDDDAVTAAMRAWRSDPAVASWFGTDRCGCTSPGGCRRAAELAESPDGTLLGGRLFTTAVAHTDGLDAVWPDVAGFVAARTHDGADLAAATRGFATHAALSVVARRATQGHWAAGRVAALTDAVLAAVAERAGSDAAWLGATPCRQALLDAAAVLLGRSHDPYPLCASICADATCRYRDAATDLFTHPRHAEASTELAGLPEPEQYVIQIAGYAANDLVATADQAPAGRDTLARERWRALACAAQVRFCGGDHPSTAAATVAAALSGAGWTIGASTNGRGTP